MFLIETHIKSYPGFLYYLILKAIQVGTDLYEKIFKQYTKKQWDKWPRSTQLFWKKTKPFISNSTSFQWVGRLGVGATPVQNKQRQPLLQRPFPGTKTPFLSTEEREKFLQPGTAKGRLHGHVWESAAEQQGHHGPAKRGLLYGQGEAAEAQAAGVHRAHRRLLCVSGPRQAGVQEYLLGAGVPGATLRVFPASLGRQLPRRRCW